MPLCMVLLTFFWSIKAKHSFKRFSELMSRPFIIASSLFFFQIDTSHPKKFSIGFPSGKYGLFYMKGMSFYLSNARTALALFHVALSKKATAPGGPLLCTAFQKFIIYNWLVAECSIAKCSMPLSALAPAIRYILSILRFLSRREKFLLGKQ